MHLFLHPLSISDIDIRKRPFNIFGNDNHHLHFAKVFLANGKMIEIETEISYWHTISFISKFHYSCG